MNVGEYSPIGLMVKNQFSEHSKLARDLFVTSYVLSLILKNILR